MTVIVPNPPTVAAPHDAPKKIATMGRKRKVHVTVLTAACTVRLASSRETLDNPPPFGGGVSGLTITALTGTVEIEWSGELWAFGIAANPSAPYVEFAI